MPTEYFSSILSLESKKTVCSQLHLLRCTNNKEQLISQSKPSEKPSAYHIET